MTHKNMFRTTLCFLLIFFTTGSIGSLWVSDEFDNIRLGINSFSIPLTILFVIHAFFKNDFWLEQKFFFGMVYSLFFICHVWGNVLLLNAVLRTEDTVLNVIEQTDEQKVLRQVAYKRGGLGILYRPRF